MLLLIKAIGILIVALGVVSLADPEKLRRFMAFWQKNKNIYLGGVLALLFGILFLSAASKCGWFISVIGVLSIIKSIFIFALGPERTKKIIGWWEGKPASVLRWVAFIHLIVGVFIIYSV